MDRRDDRDLSDEGRVLSVHLGRSANCSSVGSVVDVLFMSSVAGTAILGALAVYLGGRSGDGDGDGDGNGNGNGDGNGDGSGDGDGDASGNGADPDG